MMGGRTSYDCCTFCRNCQEIRPIMAIRCNICGRKVSHGARINTRTQATIARIDSHRIELTQFEILEMV